MECKVTMEFEKLSVPKRGYTDLVCFDMPCDVKLDKIESLKGDFEHLGGVAYDDHKLAWFGVDNAEASNDLFKQMEAALKKQSTPEMTMKLVRH